MKKTYELPISPDYISHWGTQQAGRELIANYLDSGRGVECGRNGNTYVLENKIYSKVAMSSMVLGCSTKDVSDDDTIGQFGEGMKLAIIVLLRDPEIGSVTIKNWDVKWEFKFEHSENWGTEILKMYETPLPSVEEVFRVEFPCNYSYIEDEFESYLLDRAIRNEPDAPSFSTEMATIHFVQNTDGDVYVGGLFIENSGMTRYLLNIEPSQVQLNRERSEINDETLYLRYKEVVQALMNDKDVETWTPYIQEILRSGTFAERLIKDLAEEKYIEDWATELHEKSKDKIVCDSENETDVASALGEEAVTLTRIQRQVLNQVFTIPTEQKFSNKIRPTGAHEEVLTFIEVLQESLEGHDDLINNERLQAATKRLKTLSSKWFSCL